MLITEQNIDIWYREYRKQYDKTKKYVQSRHGSVRDIAPMNRNDFKVDFLSEHESNPKASGTKIAQKLAKQELYTTSWEQAERFAQAHAQKFGGEVNMNLIQRYRMGAVKGENIWSSISEARSEYKEAGLSTYQANMLIAQEFFGSE